MKSSSFPQITITQTSILQTAVSAAGTRITTASMQNGRDPSKEDIVDMMPDVYVGRLACMFTSEVNTWSKKS